MDPSALIGFFGVILTLAVNGWLQRVQYEREIERERAGIRGTIFAELTTLLKQIDDIGRYYVKHLKGKEHGPEVVFPSSFDMSQLDSIRSQFGKLTARQALAAINAINVLRYAPKRVAIESSEERHADAPIAAGGPIRITKERLAHVTKVIGFIRDIVVENLKEIDQDSLFELVDLTRDGAWCFDLGDYLNEHKS